MQFIPFKLAKFCLSGVRNDISYASVFLFFHGNRTQDPIRKFLNENG